MSRYNLIKAKICDEFTTYLDPTPETLKISEVVDNMAKDKYDAFVITTKIVHGLINYVSDLAGYGVPEYFAGPERTLERGYGDCEDFAMTIIAVLRGLKRFKPDVSYLTIGIYVSDSFFAPRNAYHAWAYADGYILEGTAGWVVPKDDKRYIPIIGVDSDKIMIIRPIKKDIGVDLGKLLESTAVGFATGAATTAASIALSKLIGGGENWHGKK